MPPILLKKFPSEIIKNIARSDVISNNNTKIISNSKKLYRRQGQVSINNNTKTTTGTIPRPVESIPTVTILPGPVSFTLSSVTPTINPTSIIPTNIIPDATPISTNINPTVTDTDISSTATPISTVVSRSIDTIVFSTNTGVISSSNSGIIPTETSTLSSIPVEQSPIPTVNTQSSSSSPSISTLPHPIASNNRTSNNLHAWLFPILAISLLILILAFLGFIYKKKNRNRNIKNNLIQNISAGDMTDKDDSSKANSLTSSINSVPSFRIKRGKVVPGDIHIGSPPDPITSVVIDNNDPSPIAPIVTDNDKGKFKRPMLERTPTTVSAFTELVDLTDEENDSIRQSVASRLSSTPSFVRNMEENGSSNTAIPLRQERVDAIIPFSFANEGGGSSASAGSGTRTYTTSPFDNINDNDNQ